MKGGGGGGSLDQEHVQRALEAALAGNAILMLAELHASRILDGLHHVVREKYWRFAPVPAAPPVATAATTPLVALPAAVVPVRPIAPALTTRAAAAIEEEKGPDGRAA